MKTYRIKDLCYAEDCRDPSPVYLEKDVRSLINSHAALLEALEVLLKDIENNGYTLEVWGPGHPHLQQAKQALKQAKGGV